MFNLPIFSGRLLFGFCERELAAQAQRLNDVTQAQIRRYDVASTSVCHLDVKVQLCGKQRRLKFDAAE